MKLNRGITNALNLELINEISSNLKKILLASEINSLVLTSANEKFFAIGFDIPTLFELSEKDFMKFYHAFNQLSIDLFSFPKPTIAAVSGHAIAGGCILALCCDIRFIADGRKLMGLNEIKLGVPVPYPADCILRQLVSSRTAREITEKGEFYQPNELLNLGLVDRVVPVKELLNESIKEANTLGSLPHEAFKMIKQNRIETIKTRIQEKLPDKEQLFLEHWFSDSTRDRLKEAMKKF
jgi:enoyl-CoA hydratase/carnithine racemase